MNISAWAIKKPTLVILLFMIITLMGTMSYLKLKINNTPDVDFPTIVVAISQAGASPVELETEVTKKVEDSLTGLQGLKHVTSTVSDGLSASVLEFELGHPTDRALNDVRDAISKIRATLPQDISEPSITHPNQSGEPIVVYSIESKKKSIEELSYIVDNRIARELLNVNGVSQVRRSGGVDREIRVELNSERIRALGLTADSISNQIKSLNINVPSGKSKIGSQEQTIRTLGSATNIEQLKNLQISLTNGQFIKLDDLGIIKDSFAEIRQIARFDGKPVVAVSVVRAQGTSDVSVAKAVSNKIEIIKKDLSDIEFKMIRTSVKQTMDEYTASLDALILGSVLAIIVIFIFLRNWQSTLIGSLAIPLSILGTFIVMENLGYTLNFMTLLGLILAVGILVDDAIVDLENIHRHIAMGKKPLQAAFDATDEIGLAVVATTFTIVAVFIPVAFMGGIPGMFFKSFALTVSASVLFSLLVARTLTPMMGAYLLPDHAEAEVVKETFLRKTYRSILTWSIRHRFITTLSAILILFFSLFLATKLPTTFYDNGDISELALGVSLPTGSTIQDTERAVKQVEQIFMKRPEVKHVYWSIGASSQNGLVSSAGAVNEANLSIILVPPKERKIRQNEFELEMVPYLTEVSGARVAFKHFGPGGGGSKPVNILLKSNDSIALTQTANKVLSEMRKISGLRDVTTSAAELRPEVVIKPNFARAAEQGVSVLTIARTARIATQGDIDVNLPKFNTGERQINIRVKIQDQFKGDLEAIGNMLVQGKSGLLPLKSVSDIYFSSGPVQINRYDKQRQITISANLNGLVLGDAMKKIKDLPSMKNLPQGVTSGSIGEADVMNDVFTRFVTAFILAIVFVYTVLVTLFGGFLHPLTIMVALPLSIGGAVLGLMATGKPLGLMALIGVLMLMGIVTKNSILLVEHAITLENEGLSRNDAIIESSLARVRPIIMTSIAMIAGMVPIALSLGAGTEPKSPLAISVIGGLFTSTVFTLVVVPAIYTYFDDLRDFMLKIFKIGNKNKTEHKEVAIESV
ncbi:MAG: efflux RND transporter permease subunit [Candidatus Sericytochromatia bacterium]